VVTTVRCLGKTPGDQPQAQGQHFNRHEKMEQGVESSHGVSLPMGGVNSLGPYVHTDAPLRCTHGACRCERITRSRTNGERPRDHPSFSQRRDRHARRPRSPSTLLAFVHAIGQELAPEGIDLRQVNTNVGELRLAAWYQGAIDQPVVVTVSLPPFSRSEAQNVANVIRAALHGEAPRG